MGQLSQFGIKDANLLLENGAAAIASTEVNSGGEIDLGAGHVSGMLIVQVSAIEVDSDNESYKIELQGTNTSGFGTATANVVLATLHLGANEVTGATPADTGTDTPTGVYQVPFNNDFAGTTYRYVRLKVTVAGAGVTTGIQYKAWLGLAK